LHFIEFRNGLPLESIAPPPMEDNPMRYLISLDFWLWMGIGLCLTLMAAAVKPLEWVI
jgi:hypothetical protein